MKKIFMLWVLGVLSYFLSYNLYANSSSQTCTWTNTYEDNKEMTVTTRQISSGGRDGVPVYESCDQAISRAKEAVNRRLGTQHYERNITGGSGRTCSPNFTPRPCYYTPPKTAVDKDPEPREVTIRQTGTNNDGHPCYESCADAQRRAQDAWLQDEWGGHRDDLQKSIDEYNQGVDDEVASSTRKAQKTAKKQKIGGMIAMGGAALAAKKAMTCCASKTCAKCPMWWALAAGLGFTGYQMYSASGDNEGIVTEYSAGLMPDANSSGTATAGVSDSTGTGTSTMDTSTGTSTAGNQDGNTTTGDPDAPTTTGPGTTGGPPNPTTNPPPITGPDGSPVDTGPDALKNIVETGGGGYDPKSGTISIPGVGKFSPNSLDKPEFKKHLNSPAMASFNKDMAGLESQIASAMGEDDLLGDDIAGNSDSADNMMAGGGGGFSGYAGAGRGGRGGASSGGGGRNPSSASGKDKKDGSNIAGMSVKRGKDRIGVSQDNIFYMIHRRYQHKRKKQHFIETAGG